mmetsp:Transcript_104099/g.299807  ORF Transcript_104099/g.299807 Transcript_104099/m.299807 type:complete len:241 (+) Transcript_104099:4902-5624(+)
MVVTDPSHVTALDLSVGHCHVALATDKVIACEATQFHVAVRHRHSCLFRTEVIACQRDHRGTLRRKRIQILSGARNRRDRRGCIRQRGSRRSAPDPTSNREGCPMVSSGSLRGVTLNERGLRHDTAQGRVVPLALRVVHGPVDHANLGSRIHIKVISDQVNAVTTLCSHCPLRRPDVDTRYDRRWPDGGSAGSVGAMIAAARFVDDPAINGNGSDSWERCLRIKCGRILDIKEPHVDLTG